MSRVRAPSVTLFSLNSPQRQQGCVHPAPPAQSQAPPVPGAPSPRRHCAWLPHDPPGLPVSSQSPQPNCRCSLPRAVRLSLLPVPMTPVARPRIHPPKATGLCNRRIAPATPAAPKACGGVLGVQASTPPLRRRETPRTAREQHCICAQMLDIHRGTVRPDWH